MNEDIVLLDDVCQKYFNITPKIARRKGSLGMLPVPAFRLSGTRKGPMYVRKNDLDNWVHERISKAVKLNSQMKLAGAV